MNFEQFREYMDTQVRKDRDKRSVNATGPTLEAALKEASIELGTSVKKLEFELLEKGNSGFLGVGKKEYMIIAYEAAPEIDDDAFDNITSDFDDILQREDEMHKDAEVIVRLTAKGAMLKVTPARGDGVPVNVKEALDALKARAVDEIDKGRVANVVKRADEEYIHVGDFMYNPANDALLTVNITDAEMKASILVSPPGDGGADLTEDVILNFLKNNNVIHGIDLKKLKDFVDHPEYNEIFEIALGTQAKDGDDAKIIYNFETDTSQIHLRETDGRVDFKEMNKIQNVVEGQLLAKKIPAQDAKPGRTVTGRLIPAKDGKDVSFNVGKNVILSDDGLSLISKINGQAGLIAGKVNVEPLYVVNGDVNIKSGGNVVFLGSVLVKGSVDDGFKVKAAGNIEVMGNVGKSELDAEGDIIVHQGINGKNGGTIKAGKTVYSKFIENSKAEAGEHIVVSDGIINSEVRANKKIVCNGKRATIVGGLLVASEEIYAKVLGSVSGSETRLEVGYDPEKKEELNGYLKKRNELDKVVEELSKNISTMENQKKIMKKLPDDKELVLQELQSKKAKLVGQKSLLEEKIEDVENYLHSLKSQGKVSASSKVYPGVVVRIKDEETTVRREYAAVTFVNDNAQVRTTKFQALDEDYSRE